MSKFKLRFKQAGGHDTLKIFIPAIVVALVGLVIAYQFVGPPPPKTLTLAAGSAGGAYAAYAERYRSRLAENGIEVVIQTSAGSRDNLDRLQKGIVEAAFVQTGVATPEEAANAPLLALGSLYLEPLWIVYRGETLDTLTGLAGKRIAIGAEGSGTRALVMRLLADNGVSAANATLESRSSEEAAVALKAGALDAACFVTSPTSDLLKGLLGVEGLQLMSFARADALCNRHRYLSQLQLHRGVIDPATDLPPADRTLISAVATLVVHEDVHPALQDLLLDAADRIHGEGNWIEAPGAFPSPNFVEFELADQASDFYQSGRSFLQRVFPFWAATLLNRLKIMLIPLLTLLLPLFKLVPPLYQWRIRRRINCWYKALQELERAAETGEASARTDDVVEEIARIEAEVAKVTVPPAYGDDLYQLRFHTSIARAKLEGLKK